MVWQDLVITAALVLFTVSLIPQVYYGFSRKKGYITLKTSIPTFFGLCAITVVYLSLDLLFSALTSLFVALMWLLLVLQRMKYEKV